MASSAEKWQGGPPRLMLEAGLELAMLATTGAAIAALGLLPLSWRGTAVAALCYALVTLLISIGLTRHAPHRHFGLANSITLCRAAFSVLLLAIAAEEAFGDGLILTTAFRWWLTAAAAVSLLLDGVDGWAARRTKMTSEFGARFDMETDALLIVALALILIVGGIAGPWVLASGLMYYVFRLACRVWPLLTAPLFPSWRRKAVCVAQTACLIVPITPAVPPLAAQLCCLAGIALLVYSFGVDIVWLVRTQRSVVA